MISLTAFAKFEFQNLASILYFISQGFLGATVLVAQTRLFFFAHMPGKTLKLSALLKEQANLHLHCSESPFEWHRCGGIIQVAIALTLFQQV